MATGSEGPLVDVVRARYALSAPGDVPMPNDEERLVFGSLAERAVASARDETRRPRARVQLLEGAAEINALLGDLPKAIELLTLADQILPTVRVRKRRAGLEKEMHSANHEVVPTQPPPRAPAPRRGRWGRTR